MMRYFDKSIPMLAALFLVACGGGGGGSAPAQLTVASFTEFKLTENSAGSWPIEASITTLTSITNTISGGPDATSFTISGKTLTFSGLANYEAPSDFNKDGVFEVYVTTAAGSTSSTQTIYVRVTDLAEAPVIATASIPNIVENTLSVGVISAADQDRNTNLTYSLLNSSGSKDEGLLAIDSSSGVITFIAAPNFESPADLNSDNTIDFTVVVSDGTLSDQSDYSFAITNENEAPSISSSASLTANENQVNVSNILASDPDATTTLSYSLVGGYDDDLFVIDASTGVISFLSAPDFENPIDLDQDNIYNFQLNVSDGTFTATQYFGVEVLNLNEGPVFANGSVHYRSENDPASGYSIDVSALNDSTSSLTYSIEGSDADAFTISSNGILSFVDAPDYDQPGDLNGDNIFNVSVTAFDGTNTSSISMAINVVDDPSDNFGIRLPGKVAIAELKKES